MNDTVSVFASVALAVITLVSLVCTGFLLPLLRKKYGLDVQASQVDIATKLARESVQEAEQFRKNAASVGATVPGSALAERALKTFLSSAASHGLNGTVTSRAPTIIESQVSATKRLP